MILLVRVAGEFVPADSVGDKVLIVLNLRRTLTRKRNEGIVNRRSYLFREICVELKSSVLSSILVERNAATDTVSARRRRRCFVQEDLTSVIILRTSVG